MRPPNVSEAWNKIYALMLRLPLLIPNICCELVREETKPRKKNVVKVWNAIIFIYKMLYHLRSSDAYPEKRNWRGSLQFFSDRIHKNLSWDRNSFESSHSLDLFIKSITESRVFPKIKSLVVDWMGDGFEMKVKRDKV